MKARHKNASGFTVVELMVGMIAFAIMVLAVGSMLVYGYTGWKRGNDSVDMQRDVSLALRAIAKEIRMCNIEGIDTSVPMQLTCTTTNLPTSGSRSTTFTAADGHLDASGSVDMRLVRDGVVRFGATKGSSNGVVSVFLSVDIGTDRSGKFMQISTRN